MPTVDASGEVFSLSGDARYEGIVTARAGAGGRLSVALEAQACHGLSLEAGARALAEVTGVLNMILGVRATGVATAAAGVTARAQMRPDIFDRMGVIADIAAYAEASAGGRLAVTGDVAPFARWGREHLDGVALTVFMAFLEEVAIEAGVWGRVSAAAMAQAHVDVTVSLRDGDTAGVIVEAGAAAGLGAGAGYDLYGGARFVDVRRFYGRAVRALTAEAAAVARDALPAELAWAADVLEIALPTALLTAFELGQTSTLGALGPPEDLLQPLLSSLAVSLRTHLLDVALRAVPQVLGDAGAVLAELVAAGTHVAGTQELHRRLDALDAHVRANLGREVTVDDLPVLGGLLVDVADAVAPELTAGWRDAIAVLWTGLAVVAALARPVAQGSWSASVVGLGRPGGGGPVIELPQAPVVVLSAYRARLGSDVAQVGLPEAIAFLVDALADTLGDAVPSAGVVLDDLAERFGLSAGQLAEAGLGLAVGRDLTVTAAYGRVRELLADWMDSVIATHLVPALRAGGGATSEYVTQVAAPALEAVASLVLDRLDALVGGLPADGRGAFTQKLSAACSTLAYRVAVRNAVFFDHVLTDIVLDGLQDAFTDLERDLRSDPDHVITATLRTLLPVLYPANPAVAASGADAVLELAAAMATVGRDATGPAVWSRRRRDRLRQLKADVLIGFEDPAAFTDPAGVEALAAGLVMCDHVPNQPALEELAALLGEILTDTAALVVPRGVAAWSTFMLRITRSVVEEMDRLAREALRVLAELIDRLGREIALLVDAARAALDAVTAAAAAFEDALREIARILRANDRRAAIRNALRAAGADAAADAARGLGDDAVAIAVGLFDAAFTLAGPLITLAFDAAETVADDLADIIGGMLGAQTAMDAIVAAIWDAAVGAVLGGIRDLGVPLPSELSAADVADAIADALPTGLLLGFLDAAIATGQAHERALAERTRADAAVQAARDDLARRERDREAARPTGRLSITIGSPTPLAGDLRRAVVHGPPVPVLVRVAGAPPAF
ncbi:MAG: hypothetical protein IT200_11610, partial [Thermoleophilia bacterium]|nr:hypothetical protein [Thermoleophilia bacterium]